MPSPRIEDYAFLSDTRSAAMVSRSGSVDWLTFPRFDSPAAMAALVGTQENGHFSISPVGEFRTERRYLPGTLVLETKPGAGTTARARLPASRTRASHSAARAVSQSR